MFETAYAVVLRLFPARFREAYGKEALLLVRERAAEERDAVGRVRLAWDLIRDLAGSLPAAYRAAALQPMTATAGGPGQFLGFQHLESRGIEPRLFVWAAVLSFTSFWAFAGVAGAARSRLARWDYLARVPRHSQSMLARGSGAAPVAGNGLNEAERRRLVAAVVADVRQFYFDKAMGLRAADAVAAREAKGEYSGITEPAQLADVLTGQLKAVTHSMDVGVVWSAVAFPEDRGEPSAAEAARYRSRLLQNHCFFGEVQQLEGNIRYLRMDGFADVPECGPTAKATMQELNGANEVIFDLRSNRGGDPGMVMLVSAYLFDHPEYMFSPREAPNEELWTRSPVPGSELADKPVYLLTSRRTWSAAEQFSYDLKALRRATLVGETTGGGAHAGVLHRVDEHFGVAIPEVRAVNPFGTGDWEGVGVAPDVAVPAAEALATAQKLAASKRR